MSNVPRLLVRVLLTAVGWAIGGFLIASGLVALGALTGTRAMGVPDDPFAFVTVVVGGVVFALLSGLLLASGSYWAASRRVMAIVGALAALTALVVVELALAGGDLAILGGAPITLVATLVVGAVLGWCSLAIGGVRSG